MTGEKTEKIVTKTLILAVFGGLVFLVALAFSIRPLFWLSVTAFWAACFFGGLLWQWWEDRE